MNGRLWALTAFFGLFIAAITGRLYHLQVVQHEHYVEQAERQQQRVEELNPPRGTIFDAYGRELAVSGPADSIYAVPRDIQDPRATAIALSAVLGTPASDLLPKLQGRGWFAWVKRQVSREEAQRVRALKLKGIELREESKRFYPQTTLAAHVVGFVGTDFKGLAGLEQVFEKEITGKMARRIVLRDAGGRIAADADHGWAEAEPGADLHLTIDATLQHMVERELEASIEHFGARGGSAVLLDPKTGAVRAMASYPTFDPNRFNEHPDAKERWKNRVITDVFEPGSTFKMVPFAAAFEAGLIDATDVFDCQMGRIVLGGVTIRDHKPFGVLTVRDIMAKSSNVGAIKIGLKAGDQRLFEQIRTLGFGRKTGIELPGESAGILHPRERWRPITKAYVSFGQGIAVTSLQLAAAFAAVANGGELLKPYLVESIGRGDDARPTASRPQVIGRAMSASTARQLGRVLEAVSLEGGTGTRAAIEGYHVAGKTGTAQLADGRGYSRTEHMAVFAGFAPGRDPVLVGAVMIDRPRGDYHGGTVAAPVFGGILSQALLYYGIRPEREALESWPGESLSGKNGPRADEPLLARDGADTTTAPAAGGGP